MREGHWLIVTSRGCQRDKAFQPPADHVNRRCLSDLAISASSQARMKGQDERTCNAVPMKQGWSMISTVLKSCATNGFSKKRRRGIRTSSLISRRPLSTENCHEREQTRRFIAGPLRDASLSWAFIGDVGQAFGGVVRPLMSYIFVVGLPPTALLAADLLLASIHEADTQCEEEQIR